MPPYSPSARPHSSTTVSSSTPLRTALRARTGDWSAAGIQNGLEASVRTDAPPPALRRADRPPPSSWSASRIQRLRLGGQRIAGRGRPHARQQKQNPPGTSVFFVSFVSPSSFTAVPSQCPAPPAAAEGPRRRATAAPAVSTKAAMPLSFASRHTSAEMWGQDCNTHGLEHRSQHRRRQAGGLAQLVHQGAHALHRPQGHGQNQRSGGQRPAPPPAPAASPPRRTQRRLRRRRQSSEYPPWFTARTGF